MVGLGGAFVGISPEIDFDHGLNSLALVSFALTSFAVYLAIRIFQNQAAQSEADRAAQQQLLQEIDQSSSRAADSANSASVNSEKLLRLLNRAQISKTGTQLTLEREVEALNAFGAVLPERANHVLWVDDNKDWIDLERAVLAAAGIATVWVSSTSRALELLAGNSFQVVITDMGRAEGRREGYVLLDAMRERGDDTPVIVYSSSSVPAHVEEVFAHEGQGAASDPSLLFELVMGQLSP